MELSPRKRAVLAAVTKTYILTGEPVGSKALNLMLNNAPSSATIRNEMSELCSLGLLAQPHTSAGRVPTGSGFKLYVDSLMTPQRLSERSKAFIDAGFKDINAVPERLPRAAGKLLYGLTGLPSIICFETDGGTAVRRAELVPIGKRTVMLLLITADGRTRSRAVRTVTDVTKELEQRFCDIAKHRINGKSVSELNLGYMQSVTAEAGTDAFALMPLISALFEMASGIENAGVELAGEAALYGLCKSREQARRIMSLVNLREPILSLTSGITEKADVVFGKDTGFKELENGVMIAAGYSGAHRYKGTVGVIGPYRMSYDQIIPGVEYTAQKLTELLTEAQNDMEE